MSNSPSEPLAEGLFKVGQRRYKEDPVQLSGGVSATLRADVFYPAVSNGMNTDVVPDQQFPVVVLLHGRFPFYLNGDGTVIDCGAHGNFGVQRTLEDMRGEFGADVTLNETHLGMVYLAQSLATNGFVVNVIDANNLSCLDSLGLRSYNAERGELINRHLVLLRDASTGDVSELLPLAESMDMSKTALIGHSRGGAGVLFAALNPVPQVNISAVMSVAPAIYANEFDASELAMPYAAIVSGRDGDSLQPEIFSIYDKLSPAPSADLNWFKYAAYIHEANHNFYNSRVRFVTDACGIQRPGGDDGFTDPDTRLSRAQQEQSLQRLALLFLSAAIRNEKEARDALAGKRGLAGLDGIDISSSFRNNDDSPVDFNVSPSGHQGFSTFEKAVFAIGLPVSNEGNTSSGKAIKSFFYSTNGYQGIYTDQASFDIDIVSTVPHFESVAIRVAQVVGHPHNSDSVDHAIRIELEDGAGRRVGATSDLNTQPIRPGTHPEGCSELPLASVFMNIEIPLNRFVGDSGFDKTSLRTITVSTSNGPAALAFEQPYLITNM